MNVQFWKLHLPIAEDIFSEISLYVDDIFSCLLVNWIKIVQYICTQLENKYMNWVQVIDEFDQNVHFVEIDIEEDPEIAEAAGIMGTPCVQFFKNKEMLRLVM